MDELIGLLVRSRLHDPGGRSCAEGTRPHVDGVSCITEEAAVALEQAKLLADVLGVGEHVDSLDITSMGYAADLTAALAGVQAAA